MPRPIDDLHADHAIVGLGLSVLGAIAARVRAGGPFPTQDAALTLRFLREFMVATHFRKENEVVWPAMALQADSQAAAAIGKLMCDQEEAIELVSCLVMFWEPAGDLTADERAGFCDTVDALRERLRRMQATEEGLLQACRAIVPPDDQVDWVARFGAIETGRAPRADWQTRLRRLATTWN